LDVSCKFDNKARGNWVDYAVKEMNHGNAKELKAHALSLSKSHGFSIKLNGLSRLSLV